MRIVSLSSFDAVVPVTPLVIVVVSCIIVPTTACFRVHVVPCIAGSGYKFGYEHAKRERRAEEYRQWQAILVDPSASGYDQYRARTQIAYLKKNFAFERPSV